MLQVIRQIENRFPRTRGRAVPALLAVSLCALALGIGVLLLK
jgi:hypothetical protein